MPKSLAAQPLYAPLLASLGNTLTGAGTPPDHRQLNALAAARGIRGGSGAPIRFVVPGNSGMSYEERSYWLGEVETRPGNWHDGFNALIWLTYPLTKAALNERHHRALGGQRPAGNPGRGPLRDALTQFDECGVAVVSTRIDLWDGIRAHCWQEVFWTRRDEVRQCLKVFVFGHASLDLLRTPHIGLCGKALFLHVDEAFLAQPAAAQLAEVDRRMAQRFSGDLNAYGAYTRPRDFHPLPLLGIPGVTPDNAFPAYYEDTRQFRPLRRAAAEPAA